MIQINEIPFIQTKSFVGFSNFPNQVRKRESQRGFSLNILIAGETGLGKRTFMNSLFNCDLLETKTSQQPANKFNESVCIETTEAKIIEGDDTLEVCIVEAKGFGDQLDNRNSWNAVLKEIERRNDEFLQNEFLPSGNLSNPIDSRIHVCLYFIGPLACGLRKIDVEFMKAVHNRVNLVPIISKADCFTLEELEQFKIQVLREIDYHNINIYKPKSLSVDSESFDQKQAKRIPYAVVGSNETVEIEGYQYRGRKYPWGEILIEEPQSFHDFLLLREVLIEECLATLKEDTNKKLYEQYRKEKLEKIGFDSFIKGLSTFNNVEYDAEKLEEKKVETLNCMKDKILAKEKKISEAESEIMQKYRDIMQDLSEKRKKYELKLKAYM